LPVNPSISEFKGNQETTMSIASTLSTIILLLTGAPPADATHDASKPVAEASPSGDVDRTPSATDPGAVKRTDSPSDKAIDGKQFSEALKCKLEIDQGSSQRNIVAVATALEGGWSGTFTLDVQKSGANTIHSRQSGDFALGSGETKQVARIRMSARANEPLSGRLVLNTKAGETTCETK
jgi:hypothetical protein